jgi:hypothetical protein
MTLSWCRPGALLEASKMLHPWHKARFAEHRHYCM